MYIVIIFEAQVQEQRHFNAKWDGKENEKKYRNFLKSILWIIRWSYAKLVKGDIVGN